MRVVAFVGASGTGKSHRAIKLAHREGLSAVIDDGLLISNGKIVAGYSAKLEDNKMRAVKRAIFMDPQHAADVETALKRGDIKGVLILGTSDNMVEKIVEALQLPKPEKRVYIEDITSERDRKYAHNRRHYSGEHVVPLPHVELQGSWSGLIDRTFQIVLEQIGFGKKRSYEKTIVRTRFSYLGKIKIADDAVAEIVKTLLLREKDILSVNEIRITSEVTDSDGKNCTDIYSRITVKSTCKVLPMVQKLQLFMKEQLESMTAIYIRNVNICVAAVKSTAQSKAKS